MKFLNKGTEDLQLVALCTNQMALIERNMKDIFFVDKGRSDFLTLNRRLLLPHFQIKVCKYF